MLSVILERRERVGSRGECKIEERLFTSKEAAWAHALTLRATDGIERRSLATEEGKQPTGSKPSWSG